MQRSSVVFVMHSKKGRKKSLIIGVEVLNAWSIFVDMRESFLNLRHIILVDGVFDGFLFDLKMRFRVYIEKSIKKCMNCEFGELLLFRQQENNRTEVFRKFACSVYSSRNEMIKMPSRISSKRFWNKLYDNQTTHMDKRMGISCHCFQNDWRK